MSFWRDICVVGQSLLSRGEAAAASFADTRGRSVDQAPSPRVVTSPSQVTWSLYSLISFLLRDVGRGQVSSARPRLCLPPATREDPGCRFCPVSRLTRTEGASDLRCWALFRYPQHSVLMTPSGGPLRSRPKAQDGRVGSERASPGRQALGAPPRVAGAPCPFETLDLNNRSLCFGSLSRELGFLSSSDRLQRHTFVSDSLYLTVSLSSRSCQIEEGLSLSHFLFSEEGGSVVLSSLRRAFVIRKRRGASGPVTPRVWHQDPRSHTHSPTALVGKSGPRSGGGRRWE